MIGNVELITVKHLVITLNSDITALIEQGRERGHPLRRRIKILALGIHGTQSRGEDIKLTHHIDEISGRARTKPVVAYLSIGEAIEKAVGIEDVGRWPCEMIAVIIVGQRINDILPGLLHPCGKAVYVLRHLGEQLFLGDTTEGGVLLIHADVLDVIELGEDTQLRKLRYTRKEYKAKHWLTLFQRTIEITSR